MNKTNKQTVLDNDDFLRIAKETESADPGSEGYILPFTYGRAIERAVLSKLGAVAGDEWLAEFNRLLEVYARSGLNADMVTLRQHARARLLPAASDSKFAGTDELLIELGNAGVQVCGGTHGYSWQVKLPASSEAEFKNFHRALCERFDYCHDEREWKRDQVSLIEHIAKKVAASEADIQALSRPDTLRLHLGEMTAQELRTAQAAVRFALSRSAASEAGAVPTLLSSQEMADLRRFAECVQDCGTHDLEKEQVRALVKAGALFPLGFGKHQTTRYGDWLLDEAAPPAQPEKQGDVPWENFPAYLIDHCEGDTITEEGLQHALANMLSDPKYAAQPATVAQDRKPQYPVGAGDGAHPDAAGCCGATVTKRCDGCPHDAPAAQGDERAIYIRDHGDPVYLDGAETQYAIYRGQPYPHGDAVAYVYNREDAELIRAALARQQGGGIPATNRPEARVNTGDEGGGIEGQQGGGDAERIKIGAQLANVAFNWSQHPGKTLTASECQLLRSLCNEWDAARAQRADKGDA